MLASSRRTRFIIWLITSPGVPMCFFSAAVNGEFRPSPSDASSPAAVAKAMKVPPWESLSFSTLARPRPTADERVPIERATLRTKGLSRQASRNTRLALLRIPCRTAFRSTVWNRNCISSSKATSTGSR